MRRIKDDRHSLKKLKTQPTNIDHNDKFSEDTLVKLDEQEIN